MNSYKPLSFVEVCEALGVKSEQLEQLIDAGEFPQGFQIGEKKKTWLVMDVESFLHLRGRGAKPKRDATPPHTSVPFTGVVPPVLAFLGDALVSEHYGPAIYFLILKQVVVYIGATVRPMIRVQEHRQGVNKTPAKAFDYALMLPVEYEKLEATEKEMIGKINPALNTTFRTNL